MEKHGIMSPWQLYHPSVALHPMDFDEFRIWGIFHDSCGIVNIRSGRSDST
jgi:hypothetical protein